MLTLLYHCHGRKFHCKCDCRFLTYFSYIHPRCMRTNYNLIGFDCRRWESNAHKPKVVAHAAAGSTIISRSVSSHASSSSVLSSNSMPLTSASFNTHIHRHPSFLWATPAQIEEIRNLGRSNIRVVDKQPFGFVLSRVTSNINQPMTMAMADRLSLCGLVILDEHTKVWMKWDDIPMSLHM